MIGVILAQTNLGDDFGSPWGRGSDLGDLVSILLTAGFSLAGVILLFTFIFAGLGIIRGAGNNDPKATAQGKQALTYAIIGFVIVFGTFWIIKLIEIITGSTFLTAPLDAPPLPDGG